MTRAVGVDALGHPHDRAMALDRGYVPGGVRAGGVVGGQETAGALRS